MILRSVIAVFRSYNDPGISRWFTPSHGWDSSHWDHDMRGRCQSVHFSHWR